MNEAKFVINVVYWLPMQDENNLKLQADVASFNFSKKSDADKLFKKLNTSGMLDIDTITGKVSFKIISVEVLDVEKFNEVMTDKKEISE